MKIIINSQLLEYRDEGKGKVIFLLHGWGASLNTFDCLAADLAKDYRIIRLDLPGFGQSPQPTDDWFVEDYARMVQGFLEKLKITDLYAIIAHSFGGRVTIKGISSDFMKPQRVVLIGTAGATKRQTVRNNAYKVVAKIGKVTTSLPVINKLQPMLRKQLYTAAGSVDYLNAQKMKNIFLNTINEDLLPEVSKITQPTLLIWGKNDTETSLDDAESIRKELKNGNLVIFPGAGHFVYNELPERVLKEIKGFLS